MIPQPSKKISRGKNKYFIKDDVLLEPWHGLRTFFLQSFVPSFNISFLKFVKTAVVVVIVVVIVVAVAVAVVAASVVLDLNAAAPKR